MMVAGSSKSGSKYQLKHRLIGAAILVGLAVLFIPAMLGKSFLTPQKSAAPLAQGEGTNWQSSIQEAGGQASMVNSQQDTAPDDQRSSPELAESGADVAELASRTTIQPVVDDMDGKAPVPTGEPDGTGTSTADATSPATSVLPPIAEVAAPEEAATVPKTSDSAEPDTAKPAVKTKLQPAPASTVASARAAEPVKQQAKDDKWVVRVGTFARKQNAESVSDLLRNRGYSPNRIEVDTKVGRATRIWLGPYSERGEANRVSAELKEITGEKGYVTRKAS